MHRYPKHLTQPSQYRCIAILPEKDWSDLIDRRRSATAEKVSSTAHCGNYSLSSLFLVLKFTLHCTANGVFHQRFLQWMWPNSQFPVDLLTFTEEILNGKLHFLCSAELTVYHKFREICCNTQQINTVCHSRWENLKLFEWYSLIHHYPWLNLHYRLLSL